MSRENFLILLIGKKFTGKTTTGLEIANKTGKRIIAVNTDWHPAYESFTQLTVEELKHWQGDKGLVIIEDEEQAIELFQVLNTYQSNAFLIFEDAQKYISDNPPKPIQRLIINHRMRNFDVVFMYHFLKVVPPKIAGHYNIMFLFKTSDGTINLGSKYGNWETINNRRERINKHADIHYKEAIYDYE